MIFKYPFTLEPQEPEGFVVQFTDIEEAFTQGETVEAAIFNAQEVLTGILQQRLADGKEIPKPSEADTGYFAVPSSSVQSALLIRYNRNGTTMSDLARRLETSWPAAKRLEDPKHSPTLRQLERAAHALGKRLVLSFE